MLYPKARTARSLLVSRGGALPMSAAALPASGPEALIGEAKTVRNEGFAQVPPEPEEQRPAPSELALRDDHPELHLASRGSLSKSLRVAASPQKRARATDVLRSWVHAKSRRRAQLPKVATWNKLAALAGHSPKKFDADVIADVMGALIEGK